MNKDATGRMLRRSADTSEMAPPGPTGADQRARAAEVYRCLCTVGVRYEHEHPSGVLGHQWVRSPDQVLARGRRGTCLDLALVFAGACLEAGIHPLVVVTGPGAGREAHALVGVWTGGDWQSGPEPDYPLFDVVSEPGADTIDELLASGGQFVVLDPTLATDPAGRSFEDAVDVGTAHLRSVAESSGSVCVDVGLGWDPALVVEVPESAEGGRLRKPFRDPDDDESLRLVRSEYRRVRFQERAEHRGLLAFARSDSDRLRVALVHGVGGAGKTRLSGEVADELDGEGWYAGFYERRMPVEWMADEVSPLAVIVDYAESHDRDRLVELFRALQRRQGRDTLVVLAARALGGWWDGPEGLAAQLESEAVAVRVLDIGVAPRPERAERVFTAALRGFSGVPPAVSLRAVAQRWTTLDVVLLAWLSVFAGGEPPDSRDELYERVLVHEQGYWAKAWKGAWPNTDPPTPAEMSRVAALITLLNPAADAAQVAPVVELAGISKERTVISRVAETVVRTLRDSSPDLAVRPDPIGDHLMANVFGAEPSLLAAALEDADDDQRLAALQNLNRAGHTRPGLAEAVSAAIAAVDGLWAPALQVAAAQGGVVLGALEAAITDETLDLPVEDLADALPLGHATLRNLARVLADRVTTAARAAGAADDVLARHLNNQANRLSEVGDRQGALVASTEAVGLYRALVEANPAAFTPDLAASLNNQANRLSEVGRHDEAAALFEATAGSLSSASARAELRADRAGRIAADDPASAVALLTAAMRDLDQAADDPPLLFGRARREVRGAIAQLAEPGDHPAIDQFPPWARSPIDDHQAALVQEWAEAAGWAAEETFIRTHNGELTADTFAVTLDQISALNPGNPTLDRCRSRLDLIAADGLDEALAQLGALHGRADLIQQWIATPDWAASETFLAVHRDDLLANETLSLIAAQEQDAVAAQHLSILVLVRALGAADDVFDAVTDTSAATDMILDQLSHARLDVVQHVVRANPQTLATRFIAPLLAGVLTAASGDTDQSRQLIETAATQAEEHQRLAAVAALRSCAEADSERSSLWTDLADTLQQPDAS